MSHSSNLIDPKNLEAISGEDRLDQILSLLPAAIYICDAEGRITFYNDAAAGLWGRKPELGKDKWCGSFRIYHLDGSDMPLDECPMAAALTEGRSIRKAEIIVERPDGTRRNVLPCPTPIFDASGKVTGALNMLVDVTGHKSTQFELAAARDSLSYQMDRLRLAADAGKVGTWDWDIEGDSIEWSEQTYAIYGLKPGEFLPSFQTFQKIVHPEDRERLYTSLEKSICTSSTYSEEMRIVRPDGTVRWVSANGSIFKDRAGKAVRMLGAIVDITEIRESQRKLAEQARSLAIINEAGQKLNSELEHRVALRTLQLERQTSRLRLLADQLISTEQQERKRIAAIIHDHLQQILVAGKFQLAQAYKNIKDKEYDQLAVSLGRNEEFLNEALKAARSLTAELRPPVLYEGGLAAALQWLARKFENEHHLKVSLQLEETAHTLPDNLKITIFEAVKELLFNVVKHAKVCAASLVLKTAEKRTLFISVEDKGAGFNVKHEEKISSQKGFGLFSIRERLKISNAECDIISAPGKGTKVEIRIPAEEIFRTEKKGAGQGFQQDGRKAAGPGGGSIKILLADDHKIVREGIANILKDNPGFQVVAQAENGLDAVEKAAAFLPDVIIMDINMPKLNGIEAARKIKSRFPEIQIIGLSVQDENDVADSMKKAGALALLNKAGDPQDLIDMIMACSGKSKLLLT